MFTRFLQVLAVVLAVVALSGCAAAVIGGVAAGGYYASQSDRTVGTITDDAKITSAINTLYVKDKSISAMDINVDTYRGTVTLYGSVSSPSTQQRAIDLARSVNGVNNVVNKLTVVPR